MGAAGRVVIWISKTTGFGVPIAVATGAVAGFGALCAFLGWKSHK